ncbi:hypothetical protein HMPREF0491_01517 [Lachnospiraceae oral taxon 107 str. F0167]|jgi:protein traX|uniref:TraX family protein n=1 Tax=Lachnoanaerobaculum sp. Marseille-Q4761 TaxID=2819511 RepID=UPI0002083695|nr:TraX family protein [Lachnoanaerobaculum sp. Marseille-Q4761]EGG92353.1 hypothetical protein HMPREF0491_01517 [Lachnospiraceae oral taxon 107 str. F0167]MBO1869604.1 conjugal transfer protein TraX [Lachnoanaerobaculum sp. Marseille-Q4761]
MKFGLNRKQLKDIALVFMVLDNAYFRFSAVIGSVAHLITRFVAPLFAWLMVDGFFHTASKKRYCMRLWIFAVLMQIGNSLSFVIWKEGGINDNIFLTLALGFTSIWLFDMAKDDAGKKKILFNILAIFITFISLAISIIPLPIGSGIILEGGLQLIPLILIAYFFHNSKLKQSVFIGLYSILMFFFYGGFELCSQGIDMFCVNSDWMTFMVIPFIFLYNNEEGKKGSKWFFYIFYPVHLWIIAILGNIL